METEIKKGNLKKSPYSDADKEIEIRMFCAAIARQVSLTCSELLYDARRIEAYVLTGEILT